MGRVDLDVFGLVGRQNHLVGGGPDATRQHGGSGFVHEQAGDQADKARAGQDITEDQRVVGGRHRPGLSGWVAPPITVMARVIATPAPKLRRTMGRLSTSQTV